MFQTTNQMFMFMFKLLYMVANYYSKIYHNSLISNCFFDFGEIAMILLQDYMIWPNYT